MAMSLTHQIGALSGTPLTVEATTTADSTSISTVATSALWKPSAPSLKCKVTRDNLTDALSPPVSPCLSPIRADLTAACKAFSAVAEVETAADEKEFIVGGKAVKDKSVKGVPVYVMMPLDSVKMDNSVNRRKAMNASLQALKSAGVEGIMMDVWWGLVEREKPGEYNWGGYVELLEMAKKHGLKVQAVMSFHQCGGNVGDSVT